MRGRFFGRWDKRARRRASQAVRSHEERGTERVNSDRRDAYPTWSRRLAIESLEDRRLLTTTSDLTNLTLDPGSHRAGSLLVQFRDGARSAGSLAAYQVTANVDDEWSITPGLRRVEIDADADWEATLAAYQQDPNVLYAQADHRVSLQLVPDDPFFDVLYAMDNTGQGDGLLDADIDAVEAWDVTTGSRDTIVAVIDTGVDYNHPDLAANMWTNEAEKTGRSGFDDDGNGFVDDIHGYDFVSNDGNPMDDHYHGTHVAGTIGAVGNNGIGVTGVNWQVSIMALKFLDADGYGYESDAIAALNYAVANGAVISNNSWGGGPSSAAMFSAIENARAKGHIFVAAAGNDGWNNDLDPFYPASYKLDNIVSVAATDDNDQLAWFSNYGSSSVDLAAPGVNIHSTAPGGTYRDLSGTSMATPHVSGVMALVYSQVYPQLLSQHPEWTELQARQAAMEQVIDKVLGSVDPVDGALKTITQGRLNAATAVGAPDLRGPRVVSTDPSFAVAGTVDRVRLNFSEAIDPESLELEDVLSFTGPDGPIEIVSVALASSSSRSVDVTFSPQSVLGTYSLSLGVNISDLAGNLLDQDRDGTPGEDPDDAFSMSFEITDVVKYPSPDTFPIHIDPLDFLFGFGEPVRSTVTIGQNIAISDVNVQLDIFYKNLNELRIYLESPQGTQVTLVDQADAYGEDFLNTIFDDEASLPIWSGSDPYAGSYKPSSSLAAFDGEIAAGTWTLVIEAYFESLEGEGDLYSWSLEVEGDGSGGPPPPPPPPPGNSPPHAVDDELEGEVNTTLAIAPAELLANDTDPNEDTLSIYALGTINVVGGSVGYDPVAELITFTPVPDFVGLASFEYFVTDGFENSFDIGKVTIDFATRFQWHNPELAADVDKDGEASPGDALFIINLLNAVGDGPLVGLSADTEPEAYIDVDADNFLAPGDALSVINFINSQPSPSPFSMEMSSTAAPSRPQPAEIDMALLIMLLESAPDRAKR